jgi:hypothetical protein
MRRSSWLVGLGIAFLIACGLAADPASADDDAGPSLDAAPGSVIEQTAATPDDEPGDVVETPETPSDAQVAWAGA